MAAIRPPYVKVICPTAPTMPVTLNAGFRMPSWFDLFSLDATGPEDEEGKKNCLNFHIHFALYIDTLHKKPSNISIQHLSF